MSSPQALRLQGASASLAFSSRFHHVALPRRSVLFSSRTRRRHFVCNAESEGAGQDFQTLPIFPLGVVALPCADVPLQIFEARYRVLFSTLLAGEEGVNEGLVQDESPFKGSKRFGMCYSDRNGLAKFGTVLEIVQHECFEDGRIMILTKGRERFAIDKVEQEKPVLLCKVRMIKDLDEDAASLETAAAEVTRLFRDTLRLNAKYKKVTVTDEFLNPPQLDALGPSDVSFWMMSMLAEAAQMQQWVLQSESAASRLEFIRKILDDSTKYLSAAVALEGVMSPPASPTSLPDSDGLREGLGQQGPD